MAYAISPKVAKEFAKKTLIIAPASKKAGDKSEEKGKKPITPQFRR